MYECKTCIKQFFTILIILLFPFAIICDMVPFVYPCIYLEKFFSYNKELIIPIGLALWAFPSGFIILFFQKKEDCYMGITYNELFHIKFQNSKRIIEKLILLPVFIMVLACFWNMPITLFYIIFFQLLVLWYFIRIFNDLYEPEQNNQLIINDLNYYIDTNLKNIEVKGALNQNAQIFGNGEIFLLKMINRTDLNIPFHQEMLLKFLKASNLKQLNNHSAIIAGKILTDQILSTNISEQIKYNLLREWFSFNCTILLQKGIIYSLLEHINYDRLYLIYDLIEEREQIDKGNPTGRNQLVVWCVVSFAMLTQIQGHDFITIFASKIRELLHESQKHFPGNNWNEAILNEWQYMCTLLLYNPIENINTIYTIINKI